MKDEFELDPVMKGVKREDEDPNTAFVKQRERKNQNHNDRAMYL